MSFNTVNTFNRRRFLGLLGGTAAAAALPAAAAARPAAGFSFVHITDCHLEPELNGVQGVDMAMKQARALRGMDFALQGGDHVFDANGVSRERATQLFDQYGKTEQDLGLKVHHVMGNHDIFGITPASGAGPADPDYGKKMYQARFGPTYYTFDHKGHHFIVLDSVGITPDRKYEARIDDDQMQWLAKDLAAQPAGTPIIVATHIPLVTAYLDYRPHGGYPPYPGFINGPKAIEMFAGHNVLAVLQGHTHVNETVIWNGVPYITSGAVCGNWWKGPRWGVPEGFSVMTVADGKLRVKYHPTGFQSIAPETT